MVADSYRLPMKAESPTPKIDSASPEATWLAISVSVRQREDEAHRGAREEAGADARPRAARIVRDGERGDRADRHDALGAEVQHARLLGDELAQRRDDERRAGDDRREQHRGHHVFHRR